MYYIFIFLLSFYFIKTYGIDEKVKGLFKKKNNRWKQNRWTNQIYGYQSSGSNELNNKISPSLALRQIIITSCVLFAFFWTFEKFYPDYYLDVLSNFAWNTDIKEFYKKPWSMILSGFSHVAGFHLVFNMLFLQGFGRIMMMCMDDRTIWNLHIWGTVIGTLLVLLIYNIFPYTHSLGLGASCGIFAMMSAIAYKMPYYRTKILLFFIIPANITMKQMLYFGIGLSVLMIATNINAGGGWAHIGGAILGWFWMNWLDQRKDVNRGLDWFTKRVLR
jgi:membrane associated rhomboid family serine protease